MEVYATPNPTSSSTLERRSDCLSPLLFSALLGWTVLVTFGQVITQLGTSLTPNPGLRFTAIIAGLAQFVLLGLPLVPLAVWWKAPRYRAIFQTWVLASLLGLLDLPGHLADLADAQTRVLVMLFAALALGGLLLLLARRTGRGAPAGQAGWPLLPSLLFVLALAGLLAFPWLVWGSLGSLLDTLLALLAALALGWAAALLLERFLFASLSCETSPDNAWKTFLLGGLAAGNALLILASGLDFSFGGLQLLLMVALPALGWILAGLALLRCGPLWLPFTALTGLVAAAPMALVDPDELFLGLNVEGKDALAWAFQAAGAAFLIALGLGILCLVLVLFSARSAASPPLPPGTGSPLRGRKLWGLPFVGLSAIAVWAAGAALYVSAGHPGFYGERMFVILRSQPDLSTAVTMQDYNTRRSYVYRTLVDNANSTQASLRADLDRLGIVYTPFYLVNGLELPDNPALRAWLLTRPEVDRIVGSPHLRPLPQPAPPTEGPVTNPPASPPWNLTLIHADRVWHELGVTGKGVIVGQSDTGVDGEHPELAGSYRGRDGNNNYNWFDPWQHTTHPVDPFFHGTHTLAIAVGNQVGVAPGATWIACLNQARPMGNPAFYLDCMQFMLAPFPLDGDPLRDGDPSRGAMVLNNSWGCPEIEGCDPNTLLPAVSALRSAGIFFEASAGNDGPACDTIADPPALYDPAYTTGAIDSAGNLASFSSLGPVTVDGSGRIKPDILAPGVDVLSATPGDTYAAYPGTSMAGPHVVGVVALMWSANPALIGDIDRTEAILNATAQPYTGPVPACPGSGDHPSTAYGYGILDAYAAVKMAEETK